MDALGSGLRSRPTLMVPTVEGRPVRVAFNRVEAEDAAALLAADAQLAAAGGLWPRAARLLNRATELDPLSPRLRAAHAIALAHTGDLDRAAEAAATGIDIVEQSQPRRNRAPLSPGSTLAAHDKAALDLHVLLVRLYRAMGAPASEGHQLSLLCRAVLELGGEAAAEVGVAMLPDDVASLDALVEATLERQPETDAGVDETWLRGADEVLTAAADAASAAEAGAAEAAEVAAGDSGQRPNGGNGVRDAAGGRAGGGNGGPEAASLAEAARAILRDGACNPVTAALAQAAADLDQGDATQALAIVDAVLAAKPAGAALRADALHQRARCLLALSLRAGSAGNSADALELATQAMQCETAIATAAARAALEAETAADGARAPSSAALPTMAQEQEDGARAGGAASRRGLPEAGPEWLPAELAFLAADGSVDVGPQANDLSEALRAQGLHGPAAWGAHCPPLSAGVAPHVAFLRVVVRALLGASKADEALAGIRALRQLTDAFERRALPRLKPSEAAFTRAWAGLSFSESLWCPLWTSADSSLAATALDHAAVDRAAQGRAAEALTLLDEAVAAAPDVAPLRIHRAKVAMACGRPDVASTDAQAILRGIAPAADARCAADAASLLSAASGLLTAGMESSVDLPELRASTPALLQSRRREFSAQAAVQERGAARLGTHEGVRQRTPARAQPHADGAGGAMLMAASVLLPAGAEAQSVTSLPQSGMTTTKSRAGLRRTMYASSVAALPGATDQGGTLVDTETQSLAASWRSSLQERAQAPADASVPAVPAPASQRDQTRALRLGAVGGEGPDAGLQPRDAHEERLERLVRMQERRKQER
ncbi:hypothetical protein FNF29_01063 [Cafeteria roenbergensis]|uniref:Uncharacterized protein n=1 Tax=Cafeteria roenbergensis TaxID=33653 RepID=A0A5A8CVP5_CAFRO|nr:hypothetical protein FNF29_01063 [Cafeteria roenbergensis]|eukprot:KAA0156270.1 hypothetical protein FNF29_01063 [Cafeteria roenbergensis]